MFEVKPFLARIHIFNGIGRVLNHDAFARLGLQEGPCEALIKHTQRDSSAQRTIPSIQKQCKRMQKVSAASTVKEYERYGIPNYTPKSRKISMKRIEKVLCPRQEARQMHRPPDNFEGNSHNITICHKSPFS